MGGYSTLTMVARKCCAPGSKKPFILPGHEFEYEGSRLTLPLLHLLPPAAPLSIPLLSSPPMDGLRNIARSSICKSIKRPHGALNRHHLRSDEGIDLTLRTFHPFERGEKRKRKLRAQFQHLQTLTKQPGTTQKSSRNENQSRSSTFTLL